MKRQREIQPDCELKPFIKNDSPETGHLAEQLLDSPTYGLLSYVQGVDWAFLFVGTLSAVIHGAGLPILGIVLGGMTTVFLRAQSSPFVTGIVTNVTTNGLEPITQNDFDAEVFKSCLQYLMLGVMVFVTSYTQIACLESYAERLVQKLREAYLRAILRQQIDWFDGHPTGNLTSRLTDDLERVRDGIGDKFAMFVNQFSAFSAGLVLSFYYSWSMTLVLIFFGPFIVASGFWMSKHSSKRSKVELESYAVAGSIAEQAFSSIRTVHALNGHSEELNRFHAALENGRLAGLVRYIYLGCGVGSSNFLTYCTYGVAFWFGAYQISNDPHIDRGTVFTVFFAMFSGSNALGLAFNHWANFRSGCAAASTVLRVINTHPTIDPYSKTGIHVNNTRGAISFQNVHFRYPSRKDVPVLNGLSLTVKSGEKIALVGSSGCGKSTIINLLLRFYDPTKGKVTLDGQDLTEVNVQSLREQIGIVSQEPVLFDGTILENVEMGSENVTIEQVVAACKMANAHDFIKKLPDGYRTRAGEKGLQLSGGQKQRIAIARALVKNPKILLLDEATSALDSEAEREVQMALERAQTGRTTIIVAHRLSTIRNVDQIFVLQSGNIVETGNHEELMARKGVFYEMTQAQVVRLQTERDNEDSVSIPGDIVVSRKSSIQSAMSFAASIQEGKGDKLKEPTPVPTPLLKIFAYNMEYFWWFCGGVSGSAVFGLLTSLFAVVYAEIIRVYSDPADTILNDVIPLCIISIVIGLVFFAAFFISVNCVGRCGEAMTMKLRYEAFKNILRQDIAFFDDERHGTGKLCTRFASDAPNVRYVFTRLPHVLASVVTVIGALGISFWYGWKLTFPLLLVFLLLLGGGVIDMRVRSGKKMKDSKLWEEAGKVAVQAVEHIRTVQALNRQGYFHEIFCRHLKEPYKNNMLLAHFYAFIYGFSQCMLFFMYAATFYLGKNFVMNDEMKPIDVFKVFFALTFGANMLGTTSSFIPDVSRARIAATKLFELIEYPTAIDNLSNEGMKKKINGDISINNVHFTYPTRQETKVMQGLTLEIKAGQTVALVGHSGSGKSTIMSLLERFYNPDKGVITVDGVNIEDFNIANLRQQLCIVSQEPTLFNCSISENIRYGMKETVGHQEVEEAAKMANIHTFIAGLPNGYDTMVGEKGTHLSGGQKQRIAIARALVRSPAVLLLDEATSALDTESERLVQEALETAKKGRTCVVIAHRLSTIQNSDLIAVIKDGGIEESGTHEELMRRSKSYQKLVKSQHIMDHH
ncbi:unnamed protein product [Caenorhabditis sp. 36 PRJEB53466]|nr:unnamed protein product [Caenorhabditis sp. 36 PRJEB53466]